MTTPKITQAPPPAPEQVGVLPLAETSETDDLVALAERFILLKRRPRHRYEKEARHLHAWLKFMAGRGVARASDLSVQAMLDWAASRHNVFALTWNGEVSAVSAFMDHLKALGKAKNNVCWFLKQRFTSNFRPYIFTRGELRQMFRPPAGATRWQRDRAMIYSVIYACALRVSEACRFRMRDFDDRKATIFVHESKWFKDRLLPLASITRCRIRRYVRARRAGARPEDWLFVNGVGKPYRRKNLETQFVQELRRLGMYLPTHEVEGVRYGSTRLHSLRHSFAVNRFLKWYRDGADVQAVLPLLSTYLGHVDVRYSQIYLKATGLVLSEAHERFAGRWEKHFPLEP